MITKEIFLREITGFAKRYSSFIIMNTTVEDVVQALNVLCPDIIVGSGKDLGNGAVSFVAFTIPDFVHSLTKELHTIGYAETAWDDYYMEASKDGKPYDGFTATWQDGMPMYDEESDSWDAFLTITDNETGISFPCGTGGMSDYKVLKYYSGLIYKYCKK